MESWRILGGVWRQRTSCRCVRGVVARVGMGGVGASARPAGVIDTDWGEMRQCKLLCRQGRLRHGTGAVGQL